MSLRTPGWGGDHHCGWVVLEGEDTSFTSPKTLHQSPRSLTRERIGFLALENKHVAGGPALSHVGCTYPSPYLSQDSPIWSETVEPKTKIPPCSLSAKGHPSKIRVSDSSIDPHKAQVIPTMGNRLAKLPCVGSKPLQSLHAKVLTLGGTSKSQIDFQNFTPSLLEHPACGSFPSIIRW